MLKSKIEKELLNFKRDFDWKDSKVITTMSDEMFKDEILINHWNLISTTFDGRVVLFNDSAVERYLSSKSWFLYKIYNLINVNYGAMRADFFRYIYIYLEGGLYIDAKSGISKNTLDILPSENTLFVSYWNEDKRNLWGNHHKYGIENEFVNWFILAKPGSETLLKVIISMCQNIIFYSSIKYGVGSIAVLRLTGPIMFSKVIMKELKTSNSEVGLLEYKNLGLYYSIYEERGEDVATHQIRFSKHYKNLNMKNVRYNMCCRIFYLLFG